LASISPALHRKVSHDGAADVSGEEKVEWNHKLPATSQHKVLLVGVPFDLDDLILLILNDTAGHLPLGLPYSLKLFGLRQSSSLTRRR